MRFDPEVYSNIDHGYAVTIYKSQGATVDQAYVLASKTMDIPITYGAMTRRRDALRVFFCGEDTPQWAENE